MPVVLMRNLLIMKTAPRQELRMPLTLQMGKLRASVGSDKSRRQVSKRWKCDANPGVSHLTASSISGPERGHRAGWTLEEYSWTWRLGIAPCQEG